MVKQGILITPVLGEVLTNLAPLRMKHSASVPAYHKGKPTWLSLYLSHVPSHIVRHLRCARVIRVRRGRKRCIAEVAGIVVSSPVAVKVAVTE